MHLAIVARRQTPTNTALSAWPERAPLWQCLTPEEALTKLGPGDAVLGRLDVLPTLDGVDDGLWALGELEARGARVLNGAATLLACHDKYLTARLLERSGLPHPATGLITPGERIPRLPAGPLVVKPRFGSWGTDVMRCDDPAALPGILDELGERSWFKTQGALVQELVPPLGYDVRVIVARERVVGAITRVARAGEWRTNVALGGQRVPTTATLEAKELALLAARAAGAHFVGVDLLPDTRGGWTVLELNGAVELTRDYARNRNIFALIATELARSAAEPVGGEQTRTTSWATTS